MVGCLKVFLIMPVVFVSYCSASKTSQLVSLLREDGDGEQLFNKVQQLDAQTDWPYVRELGRNCST